MLSLFENKREIPKMAAAGKMTIEKLWNANNAAAQLYRFCREFLEGKDPVPAPEGPMSVAEVIKAPGMARTMSEKNVLE